MADRRRPTAAPCSSGSAASLVLLVPSHQHDFKWVGLVLVRLAVASLAWRRGSTIFPAAATRLTNSPVFFDVQFNSATTPWPEMRDAVLAAEDAGSAWPGWSTTSPDRC